MSDYPDEKQPRNTPLECVIENDQLIIRIGVDTLAWAAEHCPRLYDDEANPEPPYCKVSDKGELAHDVVSALLHEEEDGTTPLHVLFDNAIIEAMEQGSLGFEDEP